MGVCGYVFLKILGISDSGWYWKWVPVFIAFIGFELWTNAYLLKLDISIGNNRVLAILDNDVNTLFKMDTFDYIFGGLEIFVGYFIAMVLIKKIEPFQGQRP